MLEVRPGQQNALESISEGQFLKKGEEKWLKLMKSRRTKMSKTEMIAEIRSLCNANENNPYCSIYWLADMIKEIVDSPDLKENEDE